MLPLLPEEMIGCVCSFFVVLLTADIVSFMNGAKTKPSQTTESHWKLSKHTQLSMQKSTWYWVFLPSCHFGDSRFLQDYTLKSKYHSFLGASCNGERLPFMKPANLPSHQHKLFSFPLWFLAKAHSVCLPLSSSGIVLSTGMPKPRAVL